MLKNYYDMKLWLIFNSSLISTNYKWWYYGTVIMRGTFYKQRVLISDRRDLFGNHVWEFVFEHFNASLAWLVIFAICKYGDFILGSRSHVPAQPTNFNIRSLKSGILCRYAPTQKRKCILIDSSSKNMFYKLAHAGWSERINSCISVYRYSILCIGTWWKNSQIYRIASR